jgi:putative resolvase
MNGFLPSRNASKIQTIITLGKCRLYNIQKYIDENISFKIIEPSSKKSICYCRVSTNGQKDHLKTQIEYMQRQYPTHTIIKDIGSGINFKREGIKTILELAHTGQIEELVVAYKDRLCRFGFELFEHILQTQSNASIVVLNDTTHSPEEEFVNDLLQIITVFSARVNGLRFNPNKIKNDTTVSNIKTKTIT